jgi:hypothetical protein
MPHKQDPGARARAPRQEGVQSDRRRHQYQLDGDKLASANSAEAACQESSPRFHVSLVDLCRPMGAETHVYGTFSEGLSIFERNGPQERTRKNKISLYCRLRTQWGACPIGAVPRNESEGIIPLHELVLSSEGSQLDT